MKKFLKIFLCFTLLLIVIFSCFLSPCSALEIGQHCMVSVRISNPDNLPFGSFNGAMLVGDNESPLNVSYSEYMFESGYPEDDISNIMVVQDGYLSNVSADDLKFDVRGRLPDGLYLICCLVYVAFDVDYSIEIDLERSELAPDYIFQDVTGYANILYFDQPRDLNDLKLTYKIVEGGGLLDGEQYATLNYILVSYGNFGTGYADGYADGYTEGRDVGYEEGEQVGYEGGYIQGRVEGEQIGRDSAYSEQIASSWFGDIFKTVFDAVTNWTIYENPYGTFKITFGGVFGAVVGLVCLMAFLKFFAGG